jgi:hypothetical protein
MNPRTEPVRLGAAIVAVIAAGLILLNQFGVTTTNEQQAAILEFVKALIVIGAIFGVGEWVRRRVTPVADPRDNEGRPLEPRP